MLFSLAAFVLSSALAASAVDHNVLVGDGGALAFSPSSITAGVGDNVIFEFRAKNHSVTQSTFPSPCARSPNGVDSGFFLVDPAATEHPTWNITVDSTAAPLWFFCAQTVPANHCQTGMVFAINAPPDKTFDMYQANAKNSVSSGGASGASSVVSFPGATDSGIIAPPTSLPTGGVVPGGSFSSSVSSAPFGASTFGGAVISSTPVPTPTSAPAGNGALTVRGASSGAVIAIVAAVAGLLL